MKVIPSKMASGIQELMSIRIDDTNFKKGGVHC